MGLVDQVRGLFNEVRQLNDEGERGLEIARQYNTLSEQAVSISRRSQTEQRSSATSSGGGAGGTGGRSLPGEGIVYRRVGRPITGSPVAPDPGGPGAPGPGSPDPDRDGENDLVIRNLQLIAAEMRGLRQDLAAPSVDDAILRGGL